MILKILKKYKRIFFKRCCPICGAKFDEYLISGTKAKVWEELHGIGAGLRKSTCPNCGSSDRERLVYLFFKEEYLPTLKGKHIKLLHIAPELGLSKFLISCSEIEYTAGDKRCNGYSYPDYVNDIDIENMHIIPDNNFDVIICNHVLEHVDNDITAMKELYRVLKPGGFAILQVPIALKLKETIDDSTVKNPEERFVTYGQSDHVRLYGVDYPKRLERAGFLVNIKKNTIKHSKYYGINREENLYICTKK